MSNYLEFFATDDAVAILEADLLAATGTHRLSALVALAWQMRQRDPHRALTLADEADALLSDLMLPKGENVYIEARLQLIRSEAKWLNGQGDSSQALAESALKTFHELSKSLELAPEVALGFADAHWLAAWLARYQGDDAREQCELQAMELAARDIDVTRVTFAQAAMGRSAVFRDLDSAKQEWELLLTGDTTPCSAAAACRIEELRGLVAGLSSDFVTCIRQLSAAYSVAKTTGQLNHAASLALNTGAAFNQLNDYGTALQWMQRGLELARRYGGPVQLSVALSQTAETMRLVKRLDAAAALMSEALDLMASQPESSAYGNLLLCLGEVELDRQHYDAALVHFHSLEQRAQTRADLLSIAHERKGRALLELDQPSQAREAALAALEAAKSNASDQIAALRLLADIHSRHVLQTPQNMVVASASLHYLHLALEAAATIEDYEIPGDLLEALAAEYAKIGDTGKAYQCVLQAMQAREKIHTQEAANRASALQVNHETEKAKAESEHQRQLAKSHAERANTLEQANATLEQLGDIGREITANLDPNAIFTALDLHVHALLDATCFLIYQLNEEGLALKMVFGVEAGQPVPTHTTRLDDFESRTARCGRERQEIIAEILPGAGNVIAGTQETLSLMYAPLLAGDRLLGVMTIQSTKAHAYAEREVAIFRTLCAYGAIALSNAQAQTQLVQSEKMASLGQLVANVAHEINTPIGAIKSSGASIAEAMTEVLESVPTLFELLDDTERTLFKKLIAHAGEQTDVLSTREERRLIGDTAQQLEAMGVEQARHVAGVLVALRAHGNTADYVALLRHPQTEFILETATNVVSVVQSAANINNAVDRVTKIVFALKSFSRVNASETMIPANLRDGLDTVLTIYQNQIKQGTTLVQHYDEIGLLPCFPDQLNQVWTNLIHNALQAMRNQGTLTISIRRQGDTAVVSVGDSGCGIPEGIRSKIFDPFFTTKPTGEGSGLGLDIAKKIVEKHQGRIEVQSEVGVGTTFAVFLPFRELAP